MKNNIDLNKRLLRIDNLFNETKCTKDDGLIKVVSIENKSRNRYA